MTKEQQYWEDTQEALSRIFDRCEEMATGTGGSDVTVRCAGCDKDYKSVAILGIMVESEG